MIIQVTIRFILEIRNKSYKESDMCEVRAQIYDNGEEKIATKIFSNDLL